MLSDDTVSLRYLPRRSSKNYDLQFANGDRFKTNYSVDVVQFNCSGYENGSASICANVGIPSLPPASRVQSTPQLSMEMVAVDSPHSLQVSTQKEYVERIHRHPYIPTPDTSRSALSTLSWYINRGLHCSAQFFKIHIITNVDNEL